MKRISSFMLVLATALFAISGTVSAKEKDTFTADLKRANPEVVTQATGNAVFKVSADGTTVKYKVTVKDLKEATMAHIHWTPGGGEAPPVVWLFPSSPPPALIPGTTTGVLAEGSFKAAQFIGPLAGKTVEDLVKIFRSGQAYVNVHTTTYPNGEISGNIK